MGNLQSPALRVSGIPSPPADQERVCLLHVDTCPLGFKILQICDENRKQLFMQTALETLAEFYKHARICSPES